MDDDEQYSAYVSARWTRLVHAAMLLGCSFHEAEDLVQSTFVKCYVAWDKVLKADDRDAYVYRMLMNTYTSSRRRFWGRERPSKVLPEPSAGDASGSVELADSVRRALAGLGEPARAVVVLRFFADLTERQTATVLGIPSGTVKSRLSRAMEQLSHDPHLIDLPGGSAS
ncbi:MAG: SigE family RNA polymerase sigma factor [Nocardioidaceae bacterium]